MQYCTKCKNMVEDKIAVCPYCKRSKSLRAAKGTDCIFIMKASEFEASEIAAAFEEHGIKFEIQPFSLGMVSSIYDSEIMPTDKNIYVAFENIEAAKAVLEAEYQEADNELDPPTDDMPQGKRIAIQVVSVIAFLVLVALVVFSADAIANGIKGFFASL